MNQPAIQPAMSKNPVQEGWVNEVVGADEKMQTKPS